MFSAVRALDAVLPVRRGQGGCAPFTARRMATSTENRGPGVSGAKRREADLELPLIEGPARSFVGRHLCFLGGVYAGKEAPGSLLWPASPSVCLLSLHPKMKRLGASGLPVTLESSSDAQVVITEWTAADAECKPWAGGCGEP